jgi:hypothetical protein
LRPSTLKTTCPTSRSKNAEVTAAFVVAGTVAAADMAEAAEAMVAATAAVIEVVGEGAVTDEAAVGAAMGVAAVEEEVDGTTISF